MRPGTPSSRIHRKSCAGATTATGNAQLTGALAVGKDAAGHDVTLFGATTGSFAMWDESADSLLLKGAVAHTGSTTVTGATQVTGTIAVGVDDAGHDVKLYGATASSFAEWDMDTDTLKLVGSLAQTGASTQTGNAQVTGTITVGKDAEGHDVTLFGATQNSFARWDDATDSLLITGSLALTGATVVTIAISGRTRRVSGAISPAWFMPISNTPNSLEAGIRLKVRGTPQ